MPLYYIMTSVKYGTKPHSITIESPEADFNLFANQFNGALRMRHFTRVIYSHDEAGDLMVKREPVSLNADHVVSISPAYPPRRREPGTPPPSPVGLGAEVRDPTIPGMPFRTLTPQPLS